MRRFAGVVVFAILSAAAARAADSWLRLTTPHFEMITTAGEKKGRESILCFETARQFFIDIGIGHNLPEGRVQIVGFRNDLEFRPYAPNDFATAFYSGGAESDYIVLSQTGSGSFPVAVHEYMHLVARHGSRDLPIWLNEGLAELFSTLRPDGRKVAVGDTIHSHLEDVRYTGLIDLETLFAVNRDSGLYNERSHVGLFYSESWALVHMLYASSGYRTKFTRFLDAAWRGEDSAAAMRSVFGKNVADVQKDLVSYVRDGRYLNVIADVRLEKSAGDVEVTPIEEWDARLTLAGMLASSEHRTEAGQKMLEELMAEQPQRPESPALLAEMALREGRRDEAIGLFARAGELGATSPDLYFRYAMLRWSRSGDGDETVRMALRRALQLNPGHVQARIRLGFALMDHGDYAEALAELAQVKDVTPDQAFWYYHGIAYANYRLGESAPARAAIDQAAKRARGSAQQTALDHLNNAVDTAEADARENARTIAATHLPRMKGTLRALECSGSDVRLELMTEGRPVWFSIDDPRAVRMKNTGSVTVDFVCGEQAEQPVVIEYQARADSATKTIGVVRGIEFE